MRLHVSRIFSKIKNRYLASWQLAKLFANCHYIMRTSAIFFTKLTWRLLHKTHKSCKSFSLKNTEMHGGIRTLNNMAAKLRLVQFMCKDGGERRVGVELQDRSKVVDITAVDAKIPKDMRSFLETWDNSISAARELVTPLFI